MKKRFAAIFAATAVLGVTTAFAANPFSDVTPQDWAYQSVAQLAAAGVINGYPDGTFKGQNNITRYEMAQMVAKAMANEARANAEQQAMINRLADEFSSELNNLGVRVSNLENKVGNVKVTGDARLRYQGTDKQFDGEFGKRTMFTKYTTNKDGEHNGYKNNTNDKKSFFDYRGRVQFNATVNDNTTAVVRAVAQGEFGDATANDVTFDRVYVAHNFGKHVTGTVGRHNAFIGNGLIYDDTFDGATLAYNSDKFSAAVSYGQFMAGSLFSGPSFEGFSVTDADADTNPTFTVLQAKGKLGEHTTLGAFYAKVNRGLTASADDLGFEDVDGKAELQDIYGASLDFNFNKVWIGGEWATFKDDVVTIDGVEGPKVGKIDFGDKDAWVAGIGYGDYDITKEGTWDIKAQYFNLGVASPVISSTWNQPYTNDYKAWMATVDYALAKNVGLSAYATFNAKDQEGNDAPEYYRAELNFQF